MQWDPERDLRMRPLPHRSLQLGLAGEAAARYADEWILAVSYTHLDVYKRQDEWILGIEDVTPRAHRIKALLTAGDVDAARALLPPEREYPLDREACAHLLIRGGPGGAPR